MEHVISVSEVWPEDDEQKFRRASDLPSLFMLGLVTLGILAAGILTLSATIPGFPDLMPVTRASASIAPPSAQAPQYAAARQPSQFELPPGYAIAIGSETTLTGLRSYLLSGDDEFHAGWQKAADQLRRDVDRLRAASVNWSDGERLRHLGQFEKQIAGLLNEQDMIVTLVRSSNRFPGLRLYSEDVEPQLFQAEQLCAELLASLLSRPTDANAGAIDALARMRAALRRTSNDLAHFVQLGTNISRDDMMGRVVEVEEIATVLDSEIRRLPPSDADATRRLHAAIGAMTGPLDKILALRTQPQWDYARFVFDERVLPRYRDVLSALKQFE